MQVQKKYLKVYMPLVLSNDINNQHLNKEIANWGGLHLSLFPYSCNSTLGVLQYVNLNLINLFSQSNDKLLRFILSLENKLLDIKCRCYLFSPKYFYLFYFLC